MKTIAVYGSLLRGKWNHPIFLKDAKFVGSGKTVEKFPLIRSGLPYLGYHAGLGMNVSIEVYEVSEQTFADLDRLEGHPVFYCRREIDCNVDGNIVKAWCWFGPDKLDLLIKYKERRNWIEKY